MNYSFYDFITIWKEKNERIFRGTSPSVEPLISVASLRITNWTSIRKEFVDINTSDIVFYCEACM